MSQPRRSEPLPLGNEELPYSKGLMARALIATGVPADQAYGLARRIELDLAEAGEPAKTAQRARPLVAARRLNFMARGSLGACWQKNVRNQRQFLRAPFLSGNSRVPYAVAEI